MEYTIAPLPYASVQAENLAKGRVMRQARQIWGRDAVGERVQVWARDDRGKIQEPRVRVTEYRVGHIDGIPGFPMFFIMGTGPTWEAAWAAVPAAEKAKAKAKLTGGSKS